MTDINIEEETLNTVNSIMTDIIANLKAANTDVLDAYGMWEDDLWDKLNDYELPQKDLDRIGSISFTIEDSLSGLSDDIERSIRVMRTAQKNLQEVLTSG